MQSWSKVSEAHIRKKIDSNHPPPSLI